MGRVYNLVLRQTVLPTLRDTQCGFKLFTAAAAEFTFGELACRRFGFDAEVLLRASLAGLKVAEVGVVWRNAEGTRVNSMRDSFQMLVDIWRLRRRLRRGPARPRSISKRHNPG
jgi:dolichyl-phosphate beta-glucosyltransferase